MKSISRRPFLLGTTSLVAIGALSGCFGSFGATNALWRFNKGVSDSKWLQWLVFLGLAILPVYDLFILADALVLNTIEFYTGKNPIRSASKDVGGGRTLALSRDEANPSRVRAEIATAKADGSVSRQAFFIHKGDASFVVTDAGGRVLSRTSHDGAQTNLFGAEGKLLVSLDEKATESMASAIGAGGSVSAVIDEHVRSVGVANEVASARAGSIAF